MNMDTDARASTTEPALRVTASGREIDFAAVHALVAADGEAAPQMFGEQVAVDVDIIAQWPDLTQASVVVVGPDRMVILPATFMGLKSPQLTQTNLDPAAQERVLRAAVHQRDVRPVLSTPAVGAGGTRVFRTGRTMGVLIDAGQDTGDGRSANAQPNTVRGRARQAQFAASYVHQLLAATHAIGITEIRALILLHRHGDHYNAIRRAVEQFNIPANQIYVPRALMTGRLQADFRRMLRRLRARPGFGPNWSPQNLNLRIAPGVGGVLSGRLRIGTAVIDFRALTAAMANPGLDLDRASVLATYRSRPTANPIPILGDFRGAHFEAFHRAMGNQNWTRFFEGVQVISGFHHHRGRIGRGDVNGVMRLLEATLQRTGTLTAQIQTDPNRGNASAGRAATLEIMRHLGIQVHEVHRPLPGASPSNVTATGQRAQAQGPQAASHAPIVSEMTRAQLRISAMTIGADSLTNWAREFRGVDANAISAQLRAAVAVLRGQVARAAQELVTHGPTSAQYRGALSSITSETAIERRVGRAGLEYLRTLSRLPAGQVPLRIAVQRALNNGRFSQRAFRYMMTQLARPQRRWVLYGRRGGNRPQNVAFSRLIQVYSAQMFAQQALASGYGNVRPLAPSRRAAARGVLGVLAVVELVNLGAQARQTYLSMQSRSMRRNVLPFYQRNRWFQQLGTQPALVAVDTGITSNDVERDVAAINRGLASRDWDYLYIEHAPDQGRPVLSDADIMMFLFKLGAYVHNYDEYAAYFRDTGQDAVRNQGSDFRQSTWEIKAARFSGGALTEFWVPSPLLTQGMRQIASRIITNTQTLLRRVPQAASAYVSDEHAGRLQVPGGSIVGTARLRAGVVRSTVTVPGVNRTPAHGEVVTEGIIWPRNARFYVWIRSRTRAFVSGSNYNTYAQLRRLQTTDYTLTVGQNGTFWNRKLVGNVNGAVWMDASELTFD